jgi:hypothetical protein
MVYLLIIADSLMAAAFLWKYSTLPPQIPLFYSQPWGEDQLVDYWLIVLLPILLHVFFFLNIYLYNRFFFPDYLLRIVIRTVNIVLTVTFTLLFLKILFYVS